LAVNALLLSEMRTACGVPPMSCACATPGICAIAGQIVEFVRRHAGGGHGQQQDRDLRGISLEQLRWRQRDHRRQVGYRRVDGSIHVARRTVRRTRHFEADLNLHAAGIGIGRHLLDVRNAAKLAFQRSDERGRHRLRIRTRQRRLHGDGGELHRWERRQAQHQIRAEARNHQPDGEQ
jgi:hypothetical protein